MKESSIERRCKVIAENQGWVMLKLWPIFRGLPDRILLRHGGRLDFIEFKQPGGRASPMQLWWRDKLLELGFFWHLVDSIEQFRLLFGLTNTEGDQ